MKLVIAKFIDPTFYDYWACLDEIAKSKYNYCLAGGWLFEEGDKSVKVGIIIDGQKTQGRSWVVIPRECIRELTVIKEIDWEVEE